VNTHWHLDHATGNRDILAAYPDARIIASDAVVGALEGFLADSAERMRSRLKNDAVTPIERVRMDRALAIIGDRAAFVPDAPVEADGPIELGGRVFELRLASNAATEGDLWILVPEEKLAIVGDLVVSQFPFFDTGCEEGWLRALEKIEQSSWDILIPGHGERMDRDSFRRWRTAFVSMIDCARSAKIASQCAAQWQEDAGGFFSEAERNDVRELAIYYVDDILRAPKEKRMSYCQSG
jgi:glyoxylase-like metal-dependent hydrolase (beta-lactamase superfamily II)